MNVVLWVAAAWLWTLIWWLLGWVLGVGVGHRKGRDEAIEHFIRRRSKEIQ